MFFVPASCLHCRDIIVQRPCLATLTKRQAEAIYHAANTQERDSCQSPAGDKAYNHCRLEDLTFVVLLYSEWDIALSIFINILRRKRRHGNFRYGATNTRETNDRNPEGKPASARVATSDATGESWERFNFMQMPHSTVAGWHLVWNNSTCINSHRQRVHGGVLSPRQSCIF